MDTEELREKLLSDMWAGIMTCGALEALILDEDRIKNADEGELKEIGREYGYDID